MIVQVQAICRILDKKDYSFIEDNLLTRDMFLGYEAEYDFIIEHHNKYGNIPDEATFLQRFPEFELTEVNEEDEYIVHGLKENMSYPQLVDIFSHASELLKVDSAQAVEFLQSKLNGLDLSYSNEIHSVDVISSIQERVAHSADVTNNIADWFIPTGFDELDKDINGFQRGDELVVLFARTNMGKSWVAEKIASYMSEIGFRVGYFSPEMSVIDIGYRFDTLHGHLSNNAMRLGRFDDEFTLDDYQKYAEGLSNLTGKLFVTRPKDFARHATVSKLRQWIKSDKLDAIFIDGITYLSDERYKRGDSKTISLTNISEDLMELSAEMKVPVIIVVQANRGGVVDKNSTDTPELENIRDSDGIAQNASIVYAIRQIKDTEKQTFLIFDNKKMRGGEVGKSYKYKWNINTGSFESVSDSDISLGDNENTETERVMPTATRKKRDIKDVEDDF